MLRRHSSRRSHARRESCFHRHLTLRRIHIYSFAVKGMHARIRKLREAAGLSLAQVADKLKVHKTAVGAWERGICLPRGDRMASLAKTLGVTVGELYGEAP